MPLMELRKNSAGKKVPRLKKGGSTRRPTREEIEYQRKREMLNEARKYELLKGRLEHEWEMERDAPALAEERRQFNKRFGLDERKAGDIESYRARSLDERGKSREALEEHRKQQREISRERYGLTPEGRLTQDFATVFDMEQYVPEGQRFTPQAQRQWQQWNAEAQKVLRDEGLSNELKRQHLESAHKKLQSLFGQTEPIEAPTAPIVTDDSTGLRYQKDRFGVLDIKNPLPTKEDIEAERRQARVKPFQDLYGYAEKRITAAQNHYDTLVTAWANETDPKDRKALKTQMNAAKSEYDEAKQSLDGLRKDIQRELEIEKKHKTATTKDIDDAIDAVGEDPEAIEAWLNKRGLTGNVEVQ